MWFLLRVSVGFGSFPRRMPGGSGSLLGLVLFFFHRSREALIWPVAGTVRGSSSHRWLRCIAAVDADVTTDRFLRSDNIHAEKREAQAVARRSELPCYRLGQSRSQSQNDTSQIISSVGGGGLVVQLFPAGVWAVDESYRLFNCARCHRQIAICSTCDRGQHYCSPHCREIQQRRNRREAARRYQKTPHGARNNAARQKRWRLRSARRIVTTVTHHTSLSHSLLREEVPVRTESQEAPDATSYQTPPIAHRTPVPLPVETTGQAVRRCDFCGRPCGSYARWETLSAYRRRMDHNTGRW